MKDLEQEINEDSEKGIEWTMFVLLTVVLAPALAIAIVGGYGLMIWIHQMLVGPPSL